MKENGAVKGIFERYGGIMQTKELLAEHIYYADIKELEKNGDIEKIKSGYYRWAKDTPLNEVQVITRLFPDGVLCLYSALAFYGYIDDIPRAWDIAVSKDSGKSRFNIDYPFVKPYYIEPDLLEIGVTTEEYNGVSVKIYDRERLICDCLRYRNRMDKDIFNKAIKGYINDSNRNISHLNEYSSLLRISDKARELLGIWL